MSALLLSLAWKLWPAILAVGGAFLWGISQRRAGAASERNAQRAKEADAYEQHLREIADAANARPTHGLSDDPYNRD